MDLLLMSDIAKRLGVPHHVVRHILNRHRNKFPPAGAVGKRRVWREDILERLARMIRTRNLLDRLEWARIDCAISIVAHAVERPGEMDPGKVAEAIEMLKRWSNENEPAAAPARVEADDEAESQE